MGRRPQARRDGSTVLLTTQYLEEADALADEITVIDHGRVIAHDTPDGLKRIVGGQRITVRPADPDAARRASPRSSGDATGTHAEITAARHRHAPPPAATRRSPPSSPASTAPASRSPSCRCTCPASTRSSSPSRASETQRAAIIEEVAA